MGQVHYDERTLADFDKVALVEIVSVDSPQVRVKILREFSTSTLMDSSAPTSQVVSVMMRQPEHEHSPGRSIIVATFSAAVAPDSYVGKELFMVHFENGHTFFEADSAMRAKVAVRFKDGGSEEHVKAVDRDAQWALLSDKDYFPHVLDIFRGRDFMVPSNIIRKVSDPSVREKILHDEGHFTWGWHKDILKALDEGASTDDVLPFVRYLMGVGSKTTLLQLAPVILRLDVNNKDAAAKVDDFCHSAQSDLEKAFDLLEASREILARHLPNRTGNNGMTRLLERIIPWLHGDDLSRFVQTLGKRVITSPKTETLRGADKGVDLSVLEICLKAVQKESGARNRRLTSALKKLRRRASK